MHKYAALHQHWTSIKSGNRGTPSKYENYREIKCGEASIEARDSVKQD